MEINIPAPKKQVIHLKESEIGNLNISKTVTTKAA
jgi:hypothetical protein